jgi:hypothetical protein
MQSTIRTEILGFDVVLEEDTLSIASSGRPLFHATLVPADAELLSLEMTKARMAEWNQLQQLKSRAELRYRRYLGSWVVMCVAAFSAYVSYPAYVLPIVLCLLSIFLWWRAGHEEQRAERETQARRREFQPNEGYIRRRMEEEGETF